MPGKLGCHTVLILKPSVSNSKIMQPLQSQRHTSQRWERPQLPAQATLPPRTELEEVSLAFWVYLHSWGEVELWPLGPEANQKRSSSCLPPLEDTVSPLHRRSSGKCFSPVGRKRKEVKTAAAIVSMYACIDTDTRIIIRLKKEKKKFL